MTHSGQMERPGFPFIEINRYCSTLVSFLNMYDQPLLSPSPIVPLVVTLLSWLVIATPLAPS